MRITLQVIEQPFRRPRWPIRISRIPPWRNLLFSGSGCQNTESSQQKLYMNRVKTKAELQTIAHQYVERLAEKGIHIEKVIAFGSYGRGAATEQSDIDLAFISSDFDRYNLLERQQILASCRPGLIRTDVLAYSPSMLQKKRQESSLVQQILSEGMTIFPAAA
jgi:predicted nucleotidyltransferase